MNEQYNDEKVKKMLESEKIPERLEPENIKKLLDDINAPERRKKIRHRKIRRFVSAAAAVALAVGTSAYFLRPELSDKTQLIQCYAVDSMKPANEYSDIYSYFHTASNYNKFKDFISRFSFSKKSYEYAVDSSSMEIAEEAADMYDSESYADSYSENGADHVTASGADESESKEYSDTYNQEDGVLEADIVKTDGEHIIYAAGNNICVTKVNKGKFSNSYTKKVSDLLGDKQDKEYSDIQDMYIYNGRLILINTVSKAEDNLAYDGCYAYPYKTDTYVMILNIGNDSLTLEGSYVQDGSYNDVRLTSDGYMYLVTNDTKYLDFKNTDAKDLESYIPQYVVCGEAQYVPAENILIPTEKLDEVYDYVSYVNFSGLDLNSNTPWQPVDMKSVAGYSNTIYCSQNNLYVVSGYNESEITRFAIDSGTITPSASGKVKGWVNDQFSMSEYKGYFRIAVTENSGKNTVNILDMDINVVGGISDFGINEQIKSVNFSGDTAYVVTFRNTDPLYAIDLSNPKKPKMLDELKISGYSSYMQKWSDGLLVGFGAEADTDTGFETGIKLTMFDNSDPSDLKAVDSISISGTEEDYIYSEGIYDRKALYIDPERNIIGFPSERYYYSYTDYNTRYSYNFYSFENGKLVFKGSLEKEYTDMYYNCGFRRAVYIDGFLYAVSDDLFKSADASSFTEIDSVKFDIPEYDESYEYVLYD